MMDANRRKSISLLVLIVGATGGLASVLCYGQTGKDEPNLPSSFSDANNKKEERLLAQYIGDMYIALGEPNFSEDPNFLEDPNFWGEPNSSEDPNFWADSNVLGELDSLDDPNLASLSTKEDLDEYIDKQIILTGSALGKERAEANHQIQRLWRLCIPKLIANLGHPNSKINEAVMKNLILMRDEDVVKKIIAKVNSSSNPRVRYSGVFALGMMMEKRGTVIPDREVLGMTPSINIANNHIRPFLNQLEEKTSDKTMKKIIQNAREFLENPVYQRNKPQ